jgi:hypothetical protein
VAQAGTDPAPSRADVPIRLNDFAACRQRQELPAVPGRAAASQDANLQPHQSGTPLGISGAAGVNTRHRGEIMLTALRKVRKQAFIFILGAISAVCLMTAVAGKDRLPGQSYAEYKSLIDAMPVLLDEGAAQVTKDVIERSFLAHMARDADASIAELAADYSWNKVGAAGAVKMSSGLEKTYQVTKEMYEGDFFDNYLGLQTTPVAVIGNLGIQYEVEQFRNDDDSITTLRTLAIYEIKDGKLWRLWSFSPLPGNGTD